MSDLKAGSLSAPPHLSSSEYTVIRPRTGWLNFPLSEIWRYRDLLYFLAWRDLKIRYRQTVLGAGWAIFQPLIQMVIFSFFFGRLVHIPSDNVPYPIFVYSALLPWTFFANALTACNNSVLNNAGLITKVYFPRLIIPISAIGAILVDFIIAFLLLIGIMGYYHLKIDAAFIAVLPLTLGVMLTALGAGTILSALSVAYRDFRHIVPFGIQLWLFVTPVIYPPSILGSRYELLINLNPMAGLINGFRSAILGRPFQWGAIGLSLCIALLFFIVGIVYFTHAEKRFADII